MGSRYGHILEVLDAMGLPTGAEHNPVLGELANMMGASADTLIRPEHIPGYNTNQVRSELTRFPMLPNRPYVFMGGAPGFGPMGERQAGRAGNLGMLRAITEEDIERFKGPGSKWQAKGSVFPFGATLSMGMRHVLGLRPKRANDPFDVNGQPNPAEPMFMFSPMEGGPQFAEHPVLASQLAQLDQPDAQKLLQQRGQNPQSLLQQFGKWAPKILKGGGGIALSALAMGLGMHFLGPGAGAHLGMIGGALGGLHMALSGVMGTSGIHSNTERIAKLKLERDEALKLSAGADRWHDSEMGDHFAREARRIGKQIEQLEGTASPPSSPPPPPIQAAPSPLSPSVSGQGPVFDVPSASAFLRAQQSGVFAAPPGLDKTVAQATPHNLLAHSVVGGYGMDEKIRKADAYLTQPGGGLHATLSGSGPYATMASSNAFATAQASIPPTLRLSTAEQMVPTLGSVPSLPIQSSGSRIAMGSVASHYQGLSDWLTFGNPARGVPAPSGEQLAFIQATGRNRVVIGGPGSGKTATLVRAIMAEIASGRVLPSNVISLSAVHSGVSALSQEFGKFGKVLPNLPVHKLRAPSTLHSLAHQVLFPLVGQPGSAPVTGTPGLDALGIKGISPHIISDSSFMRGAIHAQTGMQLSDRDAEDLWKYIGDINTGRYRGDQATYNRSISAGQSAMAAGGPISQVMAHAIYEQTKQAGGRLDFNDMIPLATQVLQHGQGVPAFLRNAGLLSMDEIQDLKEEHLPFLHQILSNMAPGARFMAGGDPIQTLFEGMGGIPSDQLRPSLDALMSGHGGLDWHELSRNYRSSGMDVAMNNAILMHPALAKAAKSPFQVPALSSLGRFPRFAIRGNSGLYACYDPEHAAPGRSEYCPSACESRYPGKYGSRQPSFRRDSQCCPGSDTRYCATQ